MMNYVYHDVAAEQAYAQAKAQLELRYDDGKSRLKTLCELNHIHLANLAHLEQVAAKYGLDTPLRLVNELQSEREQLSQVQIEIGQLEKIINQEDASKDLTRQEYEEAEVLRKSKLTQTEIHQQNIAYLEELAGNQAGSVPLSLHNAFREEAQRLISVRQSMAKIDRQLQIFASALDIGGNLPQIGYRRKEHRELINQARTERSFQSSTLKIIGLSAVEKIFCVITWGSNICVIAQQAPMSAGHPNDTLCAFIKNLSGKQPRPINIPTNPGNFYAKVGQTILTSDLQYAVHAGEVNQYSYMLMQPSFQAAIKSEHVSDLRFDFDFHPESDAVYINADKDIIGGGRWLWWWEIQESRRRRTKS